MSVTVSQARTIWTDQCAAAAAIKERFGLQSAFDYLVAEKLMNFAEAAREYSEFARELPGFVAEVRRMFGLQELREHLTRMERERERDEADQAEAVAAGEMDEDFADPPALVTARRERFGILKEMLLEAHLGTS